MVKGTALCLRRTLVILSKKLSLEKKKLYIPKEGGEVGRIGNAIRETK